MYLTMLYNNPQAIGEARRINNDVQKNDGVEKVEADGTIIITDEARTVMKNIMGYDCKVLRLEENEERSKELLSKYAELKKKYSIA